MKKILSLLIILCTGIIHSQIVDIPDPAFKAKLLATTEANHTAWAVAGGYVSVDSNADGEIQVSEAQAIGGLFFENSEISDLTGVEAFTNLTQLHVYQNDLAAIPLGTLTNLIVLACQQNHITELDLTGLTALTTLNCDNNLLTSIDCSGNPALFFLVCGANNISYINVKNGNDDLMPDTYWGENPLEFVCADEGELDTVQIILEGEGMGDVPFSSYCSFTPGGNYNTISGSMTFDGDTNGCGGSDLGFPYVKVNIEGIDVSGATFTGIGGGYTHYTEAGDFTVTPDIDNPSWFAVAPPFVAVSFPDDNNNSTTADFCIASVGSHPEIEVILGANDQIVPGQDSWYWLVYKNNGNVTLSGDVSLAYDESVLDFISASTAPDLQSAGSLTWNYTDLLPFETRHVQVFLNANTPVETPPLNIGDTLDFTATANPTAGDEIPANNTFDFQQTAVASFDPNKKNCLEGESVSTEMIGDYLHYMINFENVGTSEAINVVVKDTLDVSKFDLGSLRVLSSSHPVNAQLNGNVAEFIFQNINLEIGGHGNILLKIKTKDNLAEGDEVENKAHIFFDYNHPVETNEARTVFEMLSVGGHGRDESVSVYPNPSHAVFNIAAGDEIRSVRLYDIQGRLLLTKFPDDNVARLDLSDRQAGIYFIKVITDDGFSVAKIIKK